MNLSDEGRYAEGRYHDGTTGRACVGEADQILEHLAWCSDCRTRLGALFAVPTESVELHHLMDPKRSARLRARILEQASRDRGVTGRRGFSVPRWLPAASGWLVAAGLASLLLSHHAFHRPLSYGWIAAALLAILCFGLFVQVVALREQIRTLTQRLRSVQQSSTHSSVSGGEHP